MSEDRPLYKATPAREKISDLDRMKRALMVYKNWIWTDKANIGELRTRLEKLEQSHEELKAYLDRILNKSDN